MTSWFRFLPFLCVLPLTAEPMPIDPLWKSAEFRKAFTASYGVDARIEPKVTSEEKAVLDAVAGELKEEDRDGAISRLTGSSLLNNSAALIFSLGNLRYEEGKSEDAIENFQKAIELYPNFRDAHRNLAVALVQDGNQDEAEPHLVRAAELGARDGLTFGLLGYVHLSKKRYAAALQAYRMAQVTMPEEVQWKLGEAECLLSMGGNREAESLFSQLLELKPTDAGIWLNLANVWLQTEEPVKAAANLELVRRMGNLPAGGLMTLGHLYLGRNLNARALAAWDEALATDPKVDLPAALSALDHLVTLSIWEEAEQFAENIAGALEMEPDSEPAARFDRARALIEFERGDPEKAVGLAEKLVRKNPTDGSALYLLARFREKTGAREEAIMLLERAAEEEDTRAEALLLHGQILVDQGDFAAALPLLENVLSLEPNENLKAYVAEVRAIRDRRP